MDDFPIVLALYFFDGQSFRYDIITKMIDKLCELRELVKKVRFLPRSRKFTCSAIGGSGHQAFSSPTKEMVGCVIATGKTLSIGKSKADLHLIDFGNCNFSGGYTTPDDVGSERLCGIYPIGMYFGAE